MLEIANTPTDNDLITKLVHSAMDIQDMWNMVHKSRMTNQEAIELAYLGVPVKERSKKYPDYRLVEMVGLERLEFWRSNLKKAA